MAIYRVCPTCGMLTPVSEIVKYFNGGNNGETTDFVCYGCGVVLVER